jgi:hypothetical protein
VIWIIIFGVLIVLFGFVVVFGAPYVPSHRRDVRKLFDYLKLGAEDLLVDAGSGDGRVLREAGKRSARAIGYEINPILVIISRLASHKYPRVSTEFANFWHIQLPKSTTIVYIFSTRKDRRKLISKMQRETDRLGRPLKLACYGNPLGERKPDKALGAYTLYTFHPLHPVKAQV